MSWAGTTLFVWSRPFEAIFRLFDRLPGVLQLAAFPILVVIWVPYACVAFPLAGLAFLFELVFPHDNRVTEKTLEELREWGNGLSNRIGNLGNQFPERHAWFTELSSHADRLVAMLAESAPNKRELANQAAQTIARFRDEQQVVPVGELIWFAKHVEKWRSAPNS